MTSTSTPEKFHSHFSRGYMKCQPVSNKYIVLCVESNVQCNRCYSSSVGLGCMFGDCPTGFTCITTVCSSYILLCELGSYSFGQKQCRYCANPKPLEAEFLPGSWSAACPWYCNIGYFRSGSVHKRKIEIRNVQTKRFQQLHVGL
jgi:hypothetical protein